MQFSSAPSIVRAVATVEGKRWTVRLFFPMAKRARKGVEATEGAAAHNSVVVKKARIGEEKKVEGGKKHKDGGVKKRSKRGSKEEESGKRSWSGGDKLYGNYDGYHRRRMGGRDGEDERLHYLREEWFRGKEVVDFGCNDGAITIEIGRKFGPKMVLGVDIDESLIRKGRKALRDSARELEPEWKASAVQEGGRESDEWIPLSFRMGGHKKPPPKKVEHKSDEFPFNIRFLCDDFMSTGVSYLLKNSCDTILLLSVTKWIHLHGGDEAVKSLFRRVYNALRPGGVLILEPQPYHTYKRKVHLHPDLKKTFSTIRLRPDKFPKYLTNKIGFDSCDVLREQQPKGQSFNRPMYLLRKSHTLQ